MASFDIGNSFQQAVNKVFDFLPQFVGAIVVLIIGYFVAKVLGRIVRRLLQKFRFDRALHASPVGNTISRVIQSPADLVGKLVYGLVFFGFITFAVSALHLAVLDQIVAGIYSYIPKVIAAIIIFLVASTVSAGVDTFILKLMGRSATAKLLVAIIPGVIMSLALFMILNQLDIAKDIVNILFTAIVGALALGLALAFGLGGREVASEILQQAYEAGRQNAGQAKADMQVAAANAKAQAIRAKQNLN